MGSWGGLWKQSWGSCENAPHKAPAMDSKAESGFWDLWPIFLFASNSLFPASDYCIETLKQTCSWFPLWTVGCNSRTSWRRTSIYRLQDHPGVQSFFSWWRIWLALQIDRSPIHTSSPHTVSRKLFPCSILACLSYFSICFLEAPE